MTPSAAASPYALPPDRQTALTRCTRFSGSSRFVSRVPGAPPRWSTAPTAPSGHQDHRRPGGPAVADPLVVPDEDTRIRR